MVERDPIVCAGPVSDAEAKADASPDAEAVRCAYLVTDASSDSRPKPHAYATPDGEWNFVFATNGKWDGFSGGPASAYYAVEQDVFAALRDDLLACLASSTASADLPDVDVLGLHRAGDTTLRLGIPADWSGPVHVRVLDAGGREVFSHLAEPMQAGQLELPVSPLTSGWHVGVIEDERQNPLGRFLLVVGH